MTRIQVAFLATVMVTAMGCGGGGDNPFVHAETTRLVDGKGRPLPLRGVALGGWLYHEPWITNFDYQPWERVVVEADRLGQGAAAREVVKALGQEDGGDLAKVQPALAAKIGDAAAREVVDAARAWTSMWGDGEAPLYDALDRRFGKAGRKQIVGAFRDAWITEADVAAIAQLGLNTVRIATGWRDLVEVEGGAQPSGALVFDEEGFRRVEQLLDWCEKYGLYAVMDLQDSPGGHNGVTGSPKRLYDDPAAQEQVVALWVEIARRLKTRTSVAAYSLLAEPTAAPTVEAMVAMYKRLHDAIRATGDRHLLVIHDGFKDLASLPKPAAVPWTGVVYSTHLFDWGVESLGQYQALATIYENQFEDAESTAQVPVFVGSFSTIVDQPFGYDALGVYLDTFEKHGWAWSIWTWKRVDDPLARELFGETTMWGVVQTPGAGWQRPDPAHDDLATMIAKMATYESSRFTTNARFAEAIRARLAR